MCSDTYLIRRTHLLSGGCARLISVTKWVHHFLSLSEVIDAHRFTRVTSRGGIVDLFLCIALTGSMVQMTDLEDRRDLKTGKISETYGLTARELQADEEVTSYLYQLYHSHVIGKS